MGLWDWLASNWFYALCLIVILGLSLLCVLSIVIKIVEAKTFSTKKDAEGRLIIHRSGAAPKLIPLVEAETKRAEAETTLVSSKTEAMKLVLDNRNYFKPDDLSWLRDSYEDTPEDDDGRSKE